MLHRSISGSLASALLHRACVCAVIALSARVRSCVAPPSSSCCFRLTVCCSTWRHADRDSITLRAADPLRSPLRRHRERGCSLQRRSIDCLPRRAAASLTAIDRSRWRRRIASGRSPLVLSALTVLSAADPLVLHSIAQWPPKQTQLQWKTRAMTRAKQELRPLRRELLQPPPLPLATLLLL